MVMAIMLFATVIAIYAFWIRPILQSRPAFRELYDKEESFFAALREKLKGIDEDGRELVGTLGRLGRAQGPGGERGHQAMHRYHQSDQGD